MKRTEQRMNKLEKTIKKLEEEKDSIDFAIIILKEEYDKTVKTIQRRNRKQLEKLGIIEKK